MISGTSARLQAEIARQSSLSNEITRLQDQVSTGKRLTVPSDDPAGYARLATIRQSQADGEAYLANVNAASATATRADAAMSSLSTMLDRARELVTAAANGTGTPESRAAAATELRGLADDATQLAQTRDTNGNPLFPDEAPVKVPIGPGTQVAATVSRNALFGLSNADGSRTDISAMLTAAADAVGSTDDAARASGTAAALTAIGTASAQVTNVHADQGLRGARLDARSDALADESVDLKTERSGIEDTDVSAAITLITSKMTTLEAAQAVFAKVSKQTLFDVL